MSHLLRDQYCAVLSPVRVLAARRRRGWGAVERKERLACGPEPGEPAWSAAALALGEWLSRPRTGPGALTVVLSNHFVRFQIVPWNDRIDTPGELERYARICFENVYGGEAASWRITVSAERAGRPRLAAAVDQALIERIEAAVAASRLRLLSVQPYLMAAFNRFRVLARQRDVLFALAEPDRVCLAATVKGQWHSVGTRAAENAPEALAALLERELQLLDLTERPELFVHAPHQAGLKLPPIAGVAPRILSLPAMRGFAPGAEAEFGMAVTGL